MNIVLRSVWVACSVLLLRTQDLPRRPGARGPVFPGSPLALHISVQAGAAGRESPASLQFREGAVEWNVVIFAVPQSLGIPEGTEGGAALREEDRQAPDARGTAAHQRPGCQAGPGQRGACVVYCSGGKVVDQGRKPQFIVFSRWKKSAQACHDSPFGVTSALLGVLWSLCTSAAACL